MATESAIIDLNDYVNEQVLAEWVDADTGKPQALGSLSTVNKQDAGLSFRVGLDSSLQQAFIRLSINVSTRVSGRPRQRQLLLVLPLHALSPTDSAFTYETFRTSSLGMLAPAIHDAGLTDSGFVICAQINLREPGYVLTPKSNAKALRPSTSTAASHLAAMKSLSQALSITLYIKPSDYARQGLRLIHDYLYDDTLKQYPLEWDDMYGGHGAQLVEWDQCELGAKGKEAESREEEFEPPPPPYASGPQEEHPRTPNPPPFEFPPSPAFVPPLLLSPTQYTPTPEVQVEQSTAQSSPRSLFSPKSNFSPQEMLSGSGVCTIPATPDCLPELRALLEKQAALQKMMTDQHNISNPPETCRKRPASPSLAASPAAPNTATRTRPEPPKRLCMVDSPQALRSHHITTATTTTTNPDPILLSPLLDLPTTPAFPSYTALQAQLFPPLPAAVAAPEPLLLPEQEAPVQPPTPQPAATTTTTTPLTDSLTTHITAWTARAFALNPHVYTHTLIAPLLLPLGKAARESDAASFLRLRARIAALFFFDPADEREEGVGDAALAEAYVGELEGLVAWMLGVDGLADVRVWGEMVELGRVGRALCGRGVGVVEEEGAAEWRWWKGVVLGKVVVGLGA